MPLGHISFTSAGPSLLKTKATAGRGPRPSPQKKQVAFQVPSEEDEVDDAELVEIIRDRQVRVARAKGSEVPLLLDPKLILNYIDVWHKDPNTPLPDFKLTPGQSHMVTHCRISGSGRPLWFEHWGARGDFASYLPAPLRHARI